MVSQKIAQHFPVSENVRECYNNNGANIAVPGGERGAIPQCNNREQLETAISGLGIHQKSVLYELLQCLLQNQQAAAAHVEIAATEESYQ